MENFPNLMKNTNLHLQEPYQAPTQINKQTQKSTCGYFIANMLAEKDNLKSKKGKVTDHIQRNCIKMNS